ncbi:kinesin-like protein KIN-14I isoform X2 [Gastrolobium bilobum]|uniref:kinesin-like protein KIN-14I isoform X2 n=1 Tax=Gastrolobium bilobum TaxID=150636 RepID=UPI002AB01C02|nr:kinesin-like protein KIN-14I isoform X2 [Gastrolobium bilobum]
MGRNADPSTSTKSLDHLQPKRSSLIYNHLLDLFSSMVIMFAYGQTGSGKTYTMTGPKEIIEKSQDVNYRALSDLFDLADQRKDTFHYDVSVQMIEIYNEQVRDLLVTDGTNRRYPFTILLYFLAFFCNFIMKHALFPRL